MCRRASGTAFATNAPCTPARFMSCKGRSSSPSTSRRRAFCSRCGSPLYSRMLDRPGLRRVRLGTLEEDPGARPVACIWVSAKAAWDTLCDDALERFDEAPPPPGALMRARHGSRLIALHGHGRLSFPPAGACR
ncbi:GFA family protein [Sorangium sp. So ce1151]|uniref:GFA family protein n=1 Tax=Sorangium sp. So ce1151 TaxID=3133332 RepID=UPI003F61E8CB